MKLFSSIVILANILLTGNAYTRKGDVFLKNSNTCCSTDPSTPSKDCKVTSLTAIETVLMAYSPGFPERFPVGKECTWSIQARRFYRIRIEFRDFYLLGTDSSKACVDQYVIVESHIKGLEMGRFCGNSGIPTIVTPGNLAVVTLTAELTYSSEKFRGFVIAFRESLETPSPQMLPPHWKNNEEFTLSPFAIKQFIRELKPADATLPTLSPTTTRPPKARFTTKRAIRNRYPATNPPRFASRPPRRRPNIYSENNNRIKVTGNNKTKKLSLPVEIIAGVVVGVVIFIFIFILITWKLCEMRKRKENKNIQNQAGDTGQGVHMSNIYPYSPTVTNPSNIPLPGKINGQTNFVNNGYIPENYNYHQATTSDYLPGTAAYPFPVNYNLVKENAHAPVPVANIAFSPNSGMPGPIPATNGVGHNYNPLEQPMCYYDPNTGAYISTLPASPPQQMTFGCLPASAPVPSPPETDRSDGTAGYATSCSGKRPSRPKDYSKKRKTTHQSSRSRSNRDLSHKHRRPTHTSSKKKSNRKKHRR